MKGGSETANDEEMVKEFSDPERELPTLPNANFSLCYAPKHVQDPHEHTSVAAQLTGKPNLQ